MSTATWESIEETESKPMFNEKPTAYLYTQLARSHTTGLARNHTSPDPVESKNQPVKLDL